MYKIDVLTVFNNTVKLFYKLHFWQKEGATLLCRAKSWFLLSLFSVGFFASAFIAMCYCTEKTEFYFLGSISISSGVLLVKDLYRYNSQSDMLYFLREICVHQISDQREYHRVSKKLNYFNRFALCFVLSISCGGCLIISQGLPIISNQKKLPLNLWFPFNPAMNKVSFWFGFIYIILAVVYVVISYLSTILIWYLMLNCSIKYELLGNDIKTLATIKSKQNNSTQPSFTADDIKSLIKSYFQIRKDIERFKFVFCKLFFVQVMISSLSICGSVCALAFYRSGHLFQTAYYTLYLVYCIFDIFSIMYLGNEMKLSSNRLSYCIFESNLIEQSESNKKLLIIWTEILQKPQELVVGKLYPLNLDTFMTIMRLAYSTFNILQNM